MYKAELDSVPIAVKVQRPGMVEAIALDFFILRRMGRYIGRYLESKSNFTVLIDDYALHLFEELDYVQESQNMARFRSLYGRMEGIYIPQVRLHACFAEPLRCTELRKNCKQSPASFSLSTRSSQGTHALSGHPVGIHCLLFTACSCNGMGGRRKTRRR